MTPVELVEAQLAAYNKRDLERFCVCYSDQVRVFRPPAAEPAIDGKAQFAEFYATERFNLPQLRAEILNRMVLGNKIIDHERIHGVRGKPFEAVVVYEAAGGLIQRVWMFAPE